MILSRTISALSLSVLLLTGCPATESGKDSGSKKVTFDHLEITPANVVIKKGERAEFAARGVFSDGTDEDFTTKVDWRTSNLAVATVLSVDPGSAQFDGLDEGTVVVIAEYAAESTAAVANLSVSAAGLVGVDVTPKNTTTAAGNTIAFNAEGVYTDGAHGSITSSVVWSSSNESVLTFAGQAAGVGKTLIAGSATVTARDTATGLENSVSVTVTTKVLTSIAVTPAAVSVAAGLTNPFTATGTYTDGSTGNLTASVTWTSSDPATATISNQAGQQGLAQSIKIGSAVMTATDTATGVTGQSTLTVTAAAVASVVIEVDGAASSAYTTYVGRFKNLGVKAILTDHTTRNLSTTAQWSTTNQSLMKVNNNSNGYAYAIAKGTVTLTATEPVSGVSASVVVTILQKFDVTFIIDNSGSIAMSDFGLMKMSIANAIPANFDITAGVSMNVDFFSSAAMLPGSFGNVVYSSSTWNSMYNLITTAPYSGQNTRTDLPLKNVIANATSGDQDFTRLVYLFTDGPQNPNSGAGVTPVCALKNSFDAKNIKIIVVGLGPQFNSSAYDQLKCLTDDYPTQMIVVPNFADAGSAIKSIL